VYVSLDVETRQRLHKVLDRARRRGFLGPGPIDPHIDRALQLFTLIDELPARAMDLGSGGGVPGLPLALANAASQWVLLEGGSTRAAFLNEAVSALSLADRVSVIAERAEVAGRGALRGDFDLVVSRSFGPPAVTAECAAPFLRTGGRLLVAEPPGTTTNTSRWPDEGLEKLGMVAGSSVGSPTAAQILVQVDPCPDTFPRRTGIPAKRPLF
jgi:16S rRNA (guanine527-N7)-methyltransferase